MASSRPCSHIKVISRVLYADVLAKRMLAVSEFHHCIMMVTA
uniref:Uncharacterized protein n=1 Tax=Anguilla anguilla TaxID=7936 RepID=A0A0E9RIR7_ANGAN